MPCQLIKCFKSIQYGLLRCYGASRLTRKRTVIVAFAPLSGSVETCFRPATQNSRKRSRFPLIQIVPREVIFIVVAKRWKALLRCHLILSLRFVHTRILSGLTALILSWQIFRYFDAPDTPTSWELAGNAKYLDAKTNLICVEKCTGNYEWTECVVHVSLYSTTIHGYRLVFSSRDFHLIGHSKLYDGWLVTCPRKYGPTWLSRRLEWTAVY